MTGKEYKEEEMHEFISWIQWKGESLFLTDKDVFSSEGKKRLEKCQDNDFIGHGAIRAFYGLRPDQGVDYEIKDFWDPEKQKKMPEQIAEKLKTHELFEKHWDLMFENYFYRSDFLYIIQCAPEPYKKKAWKQLLKKEPYNGSLLDIIYSAQEPYKSKAAKQILKREPSKSNLLDIIEFAPKPYKEKAWERLLKKNPNNDSFIYIIQYAPEPYKSKAAEQLLKQELSRGDLLNMIEYAPESYKKKAQKILNSK